MSIFATLVHAEHAGKKLNVLDTPGYPDFMGEVVGSLKVVDTAIFLLNASDPVQVGTEVSWGFATKEQLPVVFVINHIDKPGIDFPQAISARPPLAGGSAGDDLFTSGQ